MKPAGRGKFGDLAFGSLIRLMALVVVLILGAYFVSLTAYSLYPLRKFGLAFFYGMQWKPLAGIFGVLPMIYGSLVTAVIALVIGVPVSVGVAIFLSELSPPRVRYVMSFLVEMLAAIPSVVYGIWALLVLAPLLRVYIYPVLQTYLGFLPIFKGPITGLGVLTAGIVLAVMIIPIVASISRDALVAVPNSQREGAYALGMTRSEAIRVSVLGYARSGVIASIFLGFGRAFGETMAVKMVIGNSAQISTSLFGLGYTLAAVIANEFNDATSPLFRDALVEAGLVLLIISVASNVGARLLIRRLVKEGARLL